MTADHDPASGGDGDGTSRSAATDAGTHDRRRLRSARRLVVGGVALGMLTAVVVAVTGGTGGLGLVVVLLGSLVGCVLGAAHLAGFALADELRRLPVATRRPVESLVLFLVALLLILLVMGAVGSLVDPAGGAAAP